MRKINLKGSFFASYSQHFLSLVKGRQEKSKNNLHDLWSRRMKNYTRLFLTLLLTSIFVGCGSDNGDTIDYSQSEYWLSLPAKSDLNHNVDIFYVYPTEYFPASGGPLISEINDPGMVSGAKSAFQKQATAFETIGNIYAPYYRQADAFKVLSLPTIDDVYGVISGIPASDVTAAFDYYIQNYNEGRPFILASHSQGSTVVALILENYMKQHPSVFKRMIAAYSIGWSFTPDYFDRNPHLKFADGPDDTGAIISYNTQGPAFKGAKNPVVFPGAMAINPITWTRGGEHAFASQNLGSLRLDASGNVIIPVQADVMNFADAQITHIDADTSEVDPSSDTVVVLCSTVNPASVNSNLPPEGFYHNYDYPFYYENIRVNATNRTERFLSEFSMEE